MDPEEEPPHEETSEPVVDVPEEPSTDQVEPENIPQTLCPPEELEPLPDSSQSSQQIYLTNYSFNQDYSCFSIATTADFRTFLISPNLAEVSRRRIVYPCGNVLSPEVNGTGLLQAAPSPINVCSMLFQTNYLGLISREGPYKVLLWDDSLETPPHEVWSRFEVLNVLIRRDVLCVVSEYKIYVYEFGNEFRVLLHLETAGNPKGVCALSPGGPSWVLVCPGNTKGSVRIQRGLDDSVSSTVLAHANPVACLGVNLMGTMAGSASELGTVVKVYNTLNGEVLLELRRGSVGTQISSIVFRKDNRFLVVGSASPTVHVFRLEKNSSSPGLSRVVAGQSVNVPKYFQSSRAYATFRVPDFGTNSMDLRAVGSSVCGPIVAFANHQPNRLLIVHFNGLIYEAQFDETRVEPGTQECVFSGATAFFQPRPDFAVGRASPRIVSAEPGENWELI
jgi:hypothetical protein